MLYSDLLEIKSMFQIDPNDKSEDKSLGFILEMASSWIEQAINRPGLTYKQRTEYYNGSGTQKLLLRHRPVFLTPSLPSVFVDENGYFGSVSGAFTDSTSTMVYGVDYCLWLDGDDLTKSKNGILVRINDIWPKPMVRQAGYLSPFVSTGFGSIQVNYWAGYTVDTLPAAFRMACDLLVAKLRFIFPLGLELNSDAFEDKNIAIAASQKQYLMSLVMPMLMPFRNWTF